MDSVWWTYEYEPILRKRVPCVDYRYNVSMYVYVHSSVVMKALIYEESLQRFV